MHENVNKSKSRAPKTIYRPIFLTFYVVFISFSSFFYQNANTTRSNCAIIDCNLSKKHKSVFLSNTHTHRQTDTHTHTHTHTHIYMKFLPPSFNHNLVIYFCRYAV